MLSVVGRRCPAAKNHGGAAAPPYLVIYRQLVAALRRTIRMSPNAVLLLYCALILGASLAGGWLPLVVKLTHTRLQIATSAVAGLMLGVGLLHLLPDGYEQLKSIDQATQLLLAGFLVMFFIQRFFHFHHHDVPSERDPTETACAHGAHDHDHHHHGAHHHHDVQHHAHAEPHTHSESLADQSALKLTWTGAAFGLTLHTLIDGVAIAASVSNDAMGGAAKGLLGFGTFLVVVLHKPFDAMALGTLMAAGGWSRRARHWVNALFALANPIGMLIFQLGATHYGGGSQLFLGCALVFSAGTFLCIAASDLLPELQFHSHDRLKLSIALLAGLSIAVLMKLVEPG